MTTTTKSSKQLTRLLFIIYLLVLWWILIMKLGVDFSYMDKRRVNLVPFHEAWLATGKLDGREIIMNVLIFIPLGVYAGVLFKKLNASKKVLLFFSVSLLIELIQYTLRIGAFDITDVIANTSGGIIGLLLYNAIENISKDSGKAQKLINIIATIGTIVMVLFLVLLKLDLLPIKYR